MTLTAELRERAAALQAQRVPFVEATVVRAERPTSAKPGDAALVLPDGALVGFVGGACAESTVRLHGLAALQSGLTRLLRIVPDAPSGAAPPGVSADPVVVHNPCLSGGTLEVFLEPRLPPPLVVVTGDQPVARALAAVGAAAGYLVSGGDPDRPVPADATAVVVASHGRAEEPVLRAALAAGTPYIALVASRRRGGAVLDGMGLPAEERARIHSPAGLDIGARTPGQIAVSILAEIVQHTAAPRDRGPTPEPVRPPDAPTAVDPVCGMTVLAAEPTLWLGYGEARTWFCGPGCRDAFAAQSPRPNPPPS